MTDYRIDINDGLVIRNLDASPTPIEMLARTSATISEKRYGSNGKELKPVKLWGPVIFEDVEGHKAMVEILAPYFEQVVKNHRAGIPTQIDGMPTS